jgi:hypothetical protein
MLLKPVSAWQRSRERRNEAAYKDIQFPKEKKAKEAAKGTMPHIVSMVGIGVVYRYSNNAYNLSPLLLSCEVLR